MKDDINKPKHSLRDTAGQALSFLRRYALVWFVALLVGVYGFALYQIQTAHDAQPSENAIASQVQSTSTPHVDQNVVDQLQTLQDNSVNVKTLFDQARSNPFQE